MYKAKVSNIIQLPDEVIAQIAAGQVVERPVSIVKELVENSLDAGARNILIKIEDGGKQRILIGDDGCGMSAEELVLAVQAHTTSKIKTIQDLHAISSLGFRGEALYSITQAADVVLQSRCATEAMGTKIIVKNGFITSKSSVGMAVGTIITIENLFSKIPARKKFLRSAKIEFQLILQAITQLALSFPKVGFQLFHNDQLTVDILPHADHHERIRAVLGTAIDELFLPIQLTVSDYRISGYLGTPQAATVVTQSQYILVNNRPVTSQKISRIIRRAFKTLLPPGIQPPFILFLQLDPQVVDVNIHPQKTEVRFHEEDMLLTVLQTLIAQTLEKADLLFGISDITNLTVNDSTMDVGTANILREATQVWNVKEYFEDEPILQIHNLYLITQVKDGLLLIDQHAAHERILYEQFIEIFATKKLTQMELETPEQVRLPVLESQLLEDNRAVFEKLGFEFELVNHTLYIFSKIPAILKTRKIEEYLLEVLKDIQDQLVVPDIDLQSHRTIAYLACRNAIKAGEVLTQSERKNIVKKLLNTTSKYTCPHGRPVLIHVTVKDLAKMFYRIPAFRNEK